MLSRVELFERIRRDRRLEPGVSVRELARRYGVHRRTVREDLQAPRKQRHTIQRIHDRLFARRPPRRAQPQATRTPRALASAASWAI